MSRYMGECWRCDRCGHVDNTKPWPCPVCGVETCEDCFDFYGVCHECVVTKGLTEEQCKEIDQAYWNDNE